jgi:hypothetical protein
MKTKNICFAVLLVLSLFGPAYPQSPELQYEMQRDLILTNTWTDYDCLYDVVYDNYGIHYAGIDKTYGFKLNYSFIDNNGTVLEQQPNLEDGINTLCIKSFNGRVYIIARDGNEFVIYRRINGVSGMTFLKRFYPQGGYSAGSTNQTSIDAVMFDGNIYICWTGSNYTVQGTPGYTYSAIGFLKFNPNDLSVTELEPINRIAQFGHHIYYGYYIKMAMSQQKIHTVFTYAGGGITDDSLFMNRDIHLDNGIPVYENWKGILNWGTGIHDEQYIVDLKNKCSIVCTGDKLLISASLFYNYYSTLFMDIKMKYKNINDEWGLSFTQVKQNITNYYKAPPLSFNALEDRGIFGYINFSNQNFYYYSNVRKFNNENEQLLTEATIGSTNAINYSGGLSVSTLQGDCFLYKTGQNTDNYIMSRKPNFMTGNITNNALFTGNEHIGDINRNPVCHTAGAQVVANNGSNTTISANCQFYIDQNDKVEFKTGTILNILNNAQIIVDGYNASLKINPGVSVNLGENAKIIFKNGAYLDANGATFSGINNAIWQGIEFEYAGSSSIKNCTFNNALTCLKFKCDPENNNTGPLITDNTFNVASDQSSIYKYGVYSEDMNLATIGNNHFNLPSAYNAYGMLMKSSANNITSAGGSSVYKLILYNNYFDGGRIGMVLMSYASVSKPYLLYQNYFNYGTGNIADYGIAARNISGELKNSHFSGNKTKGDVTVAQCNLIMTFNEFNATYNNNNATANSVIDIAPVISGNDIIFTGGNNIFNSSSSDNIILGSYATFYINNGYNCFLTKGTGNLHLMGVLNISGTTYDAKNNFWGSQSPDYYLLNNQDPPLDITLNFLPKLPSCQTTELSVYQIIDLGNGLMDTIYKTGNNTNVTIPPDEELYNQAALYLGSANYPTAILNFKSLIDNYTESVLLSGALYDLYSSYQGLDTNADQGYRDILYSDLKTYLTAKINSNLYTAEFNDIAYNQTLMCDANMANYNDAMLGYQFIALYHPDAAIRLMAGWDYAEIEELLNGFGGGETPDINEEKYMHKAYRILEEEIAKDSTLKMMKHQYNRISSEKDSKAEVELSSKDMKVRKKAIELREKEDKMIKKAINVMMIARNLTGYQKTQHQIEDILLTLDNDNKEINADNNSNIVYDYSLSQNFPNPFNPVTKINYAMPKQGFVSLKIYDITGREVKTLVNEFKHAGYYSVDFNGSYLASGVYFYRIQSGDFVSVKKMVLIK